MWNKTTGTIRNMGRKIELSWKGNVHGTISLPHPARTSPNGKMSGGPRCLCRMGTPLSLVKLLNHPPPNPISFALHNPPESIKYIFKSQIKDSVLLIIEPKRLAVDRATVCGLGSFRGLLRYSFERMQSFSGCHADEVQIQPAPQMPREGTVRESPTKCSNLSMSGPSTDGG